MQARNGRASIAASGVGFMNSLRLFIVGAALLSLAGIRPAEAQLDYDMHSIETGSRFVIVKGSFDHEDDLSKFKDLVAREHPTVVGFDSPGGNVIKAIELGRLIRSLGLYTLQVRQSECASACSLAFMGGVGRFAEPGSIGVHKSSFSDTEGVAVADAVSEIQQLTAEIIGYMTEMGVDPGLLQLAFSYNSDDIRYLSGSEMSRYKLTTSSTPDTPTVRVEPPKSDPSPTPREQGRAVASLDVPVARSGTVRYPKGEAALKEAADPDSKSVALIRNGTPVTVDQVLGDWYAVTVGRQTGYMHYTWVRVDQFDEDADDRRYVQVKSLSSLPAAESFIKSSPVPLVAHLTAKNWFAITLKDTYADQEAKDVANALKAHGLIAKDSIVTLGNTYVRKVCCE
ncbi:hypothetical protein EHI44_29515 [Rhizobium leguminosarum]|uniref:hypothetical protein n=1 Tax=Rhizobium leguminosarum TaxID=384 RepID=UPI000FF5E253|nr:hypothetical protein [Rhizobium leguminosarum]RWY80465.1 hypothetical protein EHI44_29515 [Rhizobium leguminosarum]